MKQSLTKSNDILVADNLVWDVIKSTPPNDMKEVRFLRIGFKPVKGARSQSQAI
jgi:hypothetical protein